MKKFHYLSSWRPPRLAGLPDLQLCLHVRVSGMGGLPALFSPLCEQLVELLTLGKVKMCVCRGRAAQWISLEFQ